MDTTSKAGLAGKLSRALAEFDEGAPERAQRYRKSVRLDLGVLAACGFALLSLLLQFWSTRGWGSADWILCTQSMLQLLAGIILQVFYMRLNRLDRKDNPALIALQQSVETLCRETRIRVRNASCALSGQEAEALRSLESALSFADYGQTAALRIPPLRRKLILPALVLLAASYASILIPYFAEGLSWGAANWFRALISPAVTVAFLYVECAFLLSAHEALLLQRHLGRMLVETRLAAADLNKAAAD